MSAFGQKIAYERIARWASWVATLIGGLTILGWITGQETLASLRANYIPMAPSTALAFALLGAAVILHRGKKPARVAALAFTAVVATLAALKLSELFSSISFGVDELLVADPAMFGAVRKGRMAPLTALNLIFASIATLCLLWGGWRRWAGHTAALVTGIAAVVLLGYMHGTPLLYGGRIIPVALPTAIAFLFLGCGLIAAAGPENWPLRPLLGDSARSLLLRWFLPVVAGGTLLDGYLRAFFLEHTALNPALVSAFSTLGFVLLISAIISQVARVVGGQIDRAEAERNLAKAELTALNGELERRISARTLELQSKNAQMEEELSMARELQLALLPTQFPAIPASASPKDSAIKFFTFYYPTGGVSGDFFSIFPVSEMSVGIFICDVMGHGVRAALVTSMMRALMEQHRNDSSDPGELLTRINQGLSSLLKETETTIFATSFVLIADIARSELAYANAGHPSPLHVRRQNGDTVPLGKNGKAGPALGIFEDATYQTVRTPMTVGDVVMLFTDGLFEVESPEAELYSQEQLLEAVRRRSSLRPEELFPEILEEIRTFSARPDFEDDVCIVGLELSRIAERR